jgi:anti-sigma factor RsiW
LTAGVSQEPDKIEADDLSAYVDGELDERTRRGVEAWVARDPKAAERVAAYRVQDAALRRALADSQELGLIREILSRRPSPSTRRIVLRAAAAVAFVAIALGSGAIYFAKRQSATSGPAFAAEAAAAYFASGPDFPGRGALSATDRSLLDRWISERLGTAFASPDFSADGFTLIEGHLVPGTGSPAAQLLYRDAQGRRLAFYFKVDSSNDAVTEAAGQSRFQWIKKENIRICYWANGTQLLALTGEFDREQMLRLAQQIADGA